MAKPEIALLLKQIVLVKIFLLWCAANGKALLI
jgi:hypothetical protein